MFNWFFSNSGNKEDKELEEALEKAINTPYDEADADERIAEWDRQANERAIEQVKKDRSRK